MFCKAPWNSLVVHMDGSLLPDPVYKNSNPTKNLDEYWKQTEGLRKSLLDGKFHNNCISCKTKEDKVGWSRRKFLNQSFGHIEFHDVMDIRMLEIDMSNICNLKCKMCSGSYSTSWIPTEKIFEKFNWKDYRGFPRQYEDKGNVFKKNANNLETVKDIINKCPNIEFIAIKGGEPFAEPANIELLNYIIKNINTQNVILDIHTNGTIYNEKFINLFQCFKKVNLSISLEALDHVLYQYIRGGQNFTIEHVLDNIKKFKKVFNIYLSITTLWMAYNIFEPVKIFKYFEEQGIDSYFKNIVAFPKYLSYSVLPKEHLEKAHDLIIKNIPVNKRSTKSGILKLAEGFKQAEQDKDSYYDFLSFTKLADFVKPNAEDLVTACPWLINRKEYRYLSHVCPSTLYNVHQTKYYANEEMFFKSDMGPSSDLNLSKEKKIEGLKQYSKDYIPKIEKFSGWNCSDKLLDFGCGMGIHTNFLYDNYKYKDVTGIDLSDKAIEYARNNSKGANFLVENLYTYSPLEKFDSMYAVGLNLFNGLTEEVKDFFYIEETVKRIFKNLLKINGTFIFCIAEGEKNWFSGDPTYYVNFFNKFANVMDIEKHSHKNLLKIKRIC